jgi:5-methyltetrahydropteroyltriglutamate--homocysteine methyltransferase
MRSTVVGSYPVELKEASGFKDKLLKSVGAYDPF